MADVPLSPTHSLARQMVEKRKIWLGGNDVTLLPDEVVKSFLETKAPQEIWREGGESGSTSGSELRSVVVLNFC